MSRMAYMTVGQLMDWNTILYEINMIKKHKFICFIFLITEIDQKVSKLDRIYKHCVANVNFLCENHFSVFFEK